jgi:hemolysin III
MTMNESITAAADALGIRIPSRRELVADGIVHVVGVVAGVIGAIVLIVIAALHNDVVETIAVSIYAAGMIAMFSLSALYNLARKSRYREIFQRLDHSGIFLMIAGTYTAFTTLMLKGDWALYLTIIVWSVALFGILIKLVWPKRLEGVTTGLYIALGWVGIIALEPILTSLGVAAIVLLGAGGALYCIGVIFHLWERLPYQKAIWHGFVLVAAGMHYGAVLTALV